MNQAHLAKKQARLAARVVAGKAHRYTVIRDGPVDQPLMRVPFVLLEAATMYLTQRLGGVVVDNLTGKVVFRYNVPSNWPPGLAG